MGRRLIDANALIAEYDRVHIGPPGGARKLMEDAPAVDAVEVVRCKECKHTGDLTSKNHYDQVWCNRVGYWKDNDWYCADGERKSDA